MNAESNHIRRLLDQKLAVLIDSFGAKAHDAKKLAKIQENIGRLLEENSDAEQHIRQALEKHLESGHLRKKTYQLISSIVDRCLTEDVPTSPGDISYESDRPPVLNRPDPAAAEAGRTASPMVLTEPPVLQESGDTRGIEPRYSATTVLSSDALEPKSADDQVQVGSVLRDRFLLQRRVSGGNMGVVYKALDRRLAEVGSENPYVAIKVLSPQLARNAAAFRALQQEATKGRCLTHPNIVRFIDFDREGEVYFIVMEWLEGRTLADILDSPDGNGIDLDRSLDIVRQIGKALDYAHRCGIVHADVKPGNVMLTPNGDAKLFDFGIARVRQTHSEAQQAFDPGVLGAITPAYSSMQVLTGEEPAPSDDVFSLGCLCYRLAAGYRVFGPRNAAEAAEAGMTPQPIATLSDRQWSALKKAISYSRVTRYGTVAEFIEALDATTDDAVTIAPGDGFVPHETGGSRYWLYGLFALLLLFASAGYRFGVFDDALDWLRQTAANVPLTARIESGADTGTETPAETAAGDRAASGIDVTGETPARVPAELEADSAGPEPPQAAGVADSEAATETVEVEVDADDSVLPIDFSELPPADIDISLIETANDSVPVIVTLREDDRPLTVDLLRTGTLALPLQLRIEEVGYSGNRSPWATGQYRISEGTVIDIPARQDRARVTLSMNGDPLREADQISTLRIRQSESTRTQLARIEVVLEDDDQRRFEAELPTNTIAFAVSQVAVRERDPAVQIDVLRFNPDDQPIIVGYSVRDVTATEGEDYFLPSGYSISFGPWQRAARLLIPLVKDSQPEGDEAFTVELATRDASYPKDVFQRIVVIIRDDEIAGP